MPPDRLAFPAFTDKPLPDPVAPQNGDWRELAPYAKQRLVVSDKPAATLRFGVAGEEQVRAINSCDEMATLFSRRYNCRDNLQNLLIERMNAVPRH